MSDSWALLQSQLETRHGNMLEGEPSDARRIFHGRGGCYEGLNWCVVDEFPPFVLVTLFAPPPDSFLDQMQKWFGDCWNTSALWQGLAVQHRYLPRPDVEWLIGEEPEIAFAKRAGLKFQIRFDRQNVGFFLDMEPGRAWLERLCSGRSVLNLFAYTCAFSPIAMAAGAASVVNVDMSRSALSQGRDNHRVNVINTDRVQFLPLDILKSWSRIRKQGPYDVVIVDPPSFQKGSFVASKDYEKILKRLNELCSTRADVLLCLNAPELGSDFLQGLMQQICPGWTFLGRIPLDDVYCDVDSERQLKLLHFRNYS